MLVLLGNTVEEVHVLLIRLITNVNMVIFGHQLIEQNSHKQPFRQTPQFVYQVFHNCHHTNCCLNTGITYYIHLIYRPFVYLGHTIVT